jgi:glucosamine-6-phosphate deaminase
MNGFNFRPSPYVPFRDVKEIERVMAITRDEIEKHANPDFHIKVLPAENISHMFVTDLFKRIKASDDENKQVVLIFPNPVPDYWKVAHLINTFNVDCRNVHIFAMDEYASDEGNIAPASWKYSFKHAMMDYFYNNIREELRPPKSQIIGPTNENYLDYGSMIEDLGGADACYSGPGWTGHLAFIEPDAPEFAAESLEEWMTFGPRIVTLSPFTLAQNSMHGFFGKSGNIAAVPPKAFTIGPNEVVKSKYRMDTNSITVHGTSTSWQRLITRLAAHGPVTPLVPTSIHQLLKTDFFISEENAQNIEPDWNKGY